MDALTVWDIILTASHIMDWGPGNVARGQILSFAPIFYGEVPLPLTSARSRSIIPIDGRFRHYAIIAEIVALTDKGCIIDFGLRAAHGRERLPAEATIGAFVAGEIDIGVDGFNAYLPDVPDAASLYHRWQIVSITKVIAPLIPVFGEDGEQLYRVGDWTRQIYANVERAAVWEDAPPDTETSYVLHCHDLGLMVDASLHN